MPEVEEGLFIGHTFCVKCGSADNTAVYKKEGGYDGTCFGAGCGAYYNEKSLKENKMLDDVLDESGKPRFTATKKEPITVEENEQLKKSVASANELLAQNFIYRGVRAETLNFFGHRVQFKDGKPYRIYYPETNPELCVSDSLNTLVGYKPRTLPKGFGYGNIGLTGKRNELAGQFRFRSIHGKYILITAGELDMTSAYQMLKDGKRSEGYEAIPVVSPTTGEGSAADQLKAQYEFLDQFENIIIGFDGDAAGKKAVRKICDVLPSDKVRIANWTYKDPNAMLEKGMEKQFIADFFNAEKYEDTQIKDSVDALSGIKDFLTAPKISLPSYMHRLQNNMRGGIRSTGAIVNIIASTSVGKTFVTDKMIHHWIFNSPLVPTIISLERTAEELMVDIISIHMHKNLSYFNNGNDAWDYLNTEDGCKAQNEISVDGDGRRRLFIIDERDGSIETLKRQIEKSAKKNGSRMFIIDPLSDLLRSLGNDGQEEFMAYEKMMKKQGYVFVNVLHTRKTAVDSEGKTKFVSEYDALGSSTFVQSADINIVLNRDKMAEDEVERNTMYVDMPKCRGGITGPAAKWYFDMETRQQVDFDDWIKTQPDTSWQNDTSAPVFDSSDSARGQETIQPRGVKEESF